MIHTCTCITRENNEIIEESKSSFIYNNQDYLINSITSPNFKSYFDMI